MDAGLTDKETEKMIKMPRNLGNSIVSCEDYLSS